MADIAVDRSDHQVDAREDGRHVYLRPVTPAAYAFLCAAEQGGELGVRFP
jgi:hypothetical protein